MIRIVQYSREYKSAWDNFIAHSKNGVFLFFRDYIEYHSDRFVDHSLLIYSDDELIALLPANIKDMTLVSHGGLTFGGIVSDEEMRSGLMLEVFDALIAYLRTRGVTRFIYKAIPHIYHSIPAEEDTFALFRHGARIVRRDVSSTIDMRKIPVQDKGRKWGLKQSKANGVLVSRSQDFRTFMEIEETLLQTKYNEKPVHSAAEIDLLASRFPENIKLFAAHVEGKMVAGVIMYESVNVAHAQYIGSTELGRKKSSLDAILSFLLHDYYAGKRYFDFGKSTDRDGIGINAGVLQYKESYGARATTYDFYELNLIQTG